jgi:ATP-dependent DNA ligase
VCFGHADATALEPASLYAFDMLAIDGEDVRKSPLFERKERPAQLLGGIRPVR